MDANFAVSRKAETFQVKSVVMEGMKHLALDSSNYATMYCS